MSIAAHILKRDVKFLYQNLTAPGADQRYVSWRSSGARRFVADEQVTVRPPALK